MSVLWGVGVVDQLNLSELAWQYAGRGSAAYPPSMLLDVPVEIVRRETRLSAIAQVQTKIKQRAAEQQQYESKPAKRQTRRDACKKHLDKDPESPTSGPKDADQVNLTDEKSRIMPNSGGGFGQNYNAQAAVGTDTMLVAAHITQATNDKSAIVPALNKISACRPLNGSDTNIGLAAAKKSPRFNFNGPIGLKSDDLPSSDRSGYGVETCLCLHRLPVRSCC